MSALVDLFQLYAFVDQTVAALREQFSEEIACERGCADCCSAVFDISYVEAVCLAARFRELDQADQEDLWLRAKPALDQWQDLLTRQEDQAVARIRCPLLTEEDVCLFYEVRPINCRTYGVPTVIGGKAHVCGLSRFEKGVTYPTIQLEPLQQSLIQYSQNLCGEEVGQQRFPVATVLLEPDRFIAFLS